MFSALVGAEDCGGIGVDGAQDGGDGCEDGGGALNKSSSIGLRKSQPLHPPKYMRERLYRKQEILTTGPARD